MLKKTVLFLLLLNLANPVLAAGLAELETTAQKLIKAVSNKDETTLKYISTRGFWNRAEDSLNQFYSQMVRQIEKSKGDFVLVAKPVKVTEDRGIVQYDLSLKSTGKILDTVYFYAAIDGDMWVFIGVNENLSEAEAFLKGSRPAGFK